MRREVVVEAATAAGRREEGRDEDCGGWSACTPLAHGGLTVGVLQGPGGGECPPHSAGECGGAGGAGGRSRGGYWSAGEGAAVSRGAGERGPRTPMPQTTDCGVIYGMWTCCFVTHQTSTPTATRLSAPRHSRHARHRDRLQWTPARPLLQTSSASVRPPGSAPDPMPTHARSTGTASRTLATPAAAARSSATGCSPSAATARRRPSCASMTAAAVAAAVSGPATGERVPASVQLATAREARSAGAQSTARTARPPARKSRPRRRRPPPTPASRPSSKPA